MTGKWAILFLVQTAKNISIQAFQLEFGKSLKALIHLEVIMIIILEGDIGLTFEQIRFQEIL